MAPRLDIEKQRMPTGDEKRGERWHRVSLLEGGRKKMPLHVMHADDWHTERIGQRFREADADEQRSDEARTISDGDRLDVLTTDLRVAEGALDDWYERRDMRARCDLGHDTTEDPVYVLRENDEGSNRRVVAMSG